MSKKNDQFANIALNKIDNEGKDIYCPEPVKLNSTILPFNGKKDFDQLKTIDTKEELYVLVDELKENLRPFLQNMAPELKSQREIIDLTGFDFKMLNDTSWKKITIPHYDGPLGVQTSLYKTTFNISNIDKTKAYYTCFKGVDYIAEVYVNDNFVGSHTGFFSPFEFDFSEFVKEGENRLLIKVKNDYIWMGNTDDSGDGIRYEGEKIYAATGPGYNDSQYGWHHCPPGFGIYQGVQIEVRNRVFISNIFVRPITEESRAELWLEVTNTSKEALSTSIDISVFGQNFRETTYKLRDYLPSTGRTFGLGDSFTEQNLIKNSLLDKPVDLLTEKGTNVFKINIEMGNFKYWDPDTPYLYQLQAKVSVDNRLLDSGKSQFGMRSFILDTDCKPKGFYYLNGKKIRLRGANTMGHEQQCVMNGDFDQLLTDLILAKACNMNFLRLTQRPVQSEIYELCDKIGLMTQTDMPLFAVIRRGSVSELLRQTEEMERLVRNHPSNIMVSYINEPLPNAGNKPHRHLTRDEMNRYFDMADSIIKMTNPDRVTKHVDGDYDPPSKSLPDNHCYNMWYNGHGLDIGKLHKGHWQYVKRGWNYACGEFGIEGLEDVSIMQKYYPESWLKQTNGGWRPEKIVGAQSENFHYLFYKTPKTMEDWVEKSQNYQALGIKTMTEAFRRDNKMVCFALHLFIDAFPSGWMKTIMDVDRNPKKGFFAYRDALEPLKVNLRTDKTRYFCGDDITAEVWICNDTNREDDNLELIYSTEDINGVISSGSINAKIKDCSSDYQGLIKFKTPEATQRQTIKINVGLISKGKILSTDTLYIELFPIVVIDKKITTFSFGNELSVEIIKGLNLDTKQKNTIPDLILIDNYSDFSSREKSILKSVRQGATLMFLSLEDGEYDITGEQVEVKGSSMMPIHFVSIHEDSELSELFYEDDFRFWYDPKEDVIKPIIYSTFVSDGFKPILESGNTNDIGEWNSAMALGVKEYGKGKIYISMLDLNNKISCNPIVIKLLTHLFY